MEANDNVTLPEEFGLLIGGSRSMKMGERIGASDGAESPLVRYLTGCMNGEKPDRGLECCCALWPVHLNGLFGRSRMWDAHVGLRGLTSAAHVAHVQL